MLQNLETVAVLPNQMQFLLESAMGMPITAYEGKVAELRGKDAETGADEYLVFVKKSEDEGFTFGIIVQELGIDAPFRAEDGREGDHIQAVGYVRNATDEEMEVSIPEADFDLFL